MSKESLARAANSNNLEMASGVVHDVDRLTAMATGDVLGGLLLRFRESDQPQWAKRISLILAKRIGDKHRLTRGISLRTAVAALEEFRSPNCSVCLGARVRMFDQLKVICSGCEGSGQQRFDNASRRARIGTYGRLIDSAMSDCHRWMTDSVSAFLGHAAGRLA